MHSIHAVSALILVRINPEPSHSAPLAPGQLDTACRLALALALHFSSPLSSSRQAPTHPASPVGPAHIDITMGSLPWRITTDLVILALFCWQDLTPSPQHTHTLRTFLHPARKPPCRYRVALICRSASLCSPGLTQRIAKGHDGHCTSALRFRAAALCRTHPPVWPVAP